MCPLENKYTYNNVDAVIEFSPPLVLGCCVFSAANSSPPQVHNVPERWHKGDEDLIVGFQRVYTAAKKVWSAQRVTANVALAYIEVHFFGLFLAAFAVSVDTIDLPLCACTHRGSHIICSSFYVPGPLTPSSCHLRRA